MDKVDHHRNNSQFVGKVKVLFVEERVLDGVANDWLHKVSLVEDVPFVHGQ